MVTKEEMWEIPLADLIVETLPKTEDAHGPDYANMARAVLTVRATKEAADRSADAAERAAESAARSANATRLLVAATVVLVVVEIIRALLG